MHHLFARQIKQGTMATQKQALAMHHRSLRSGGLPTHAPRQHKKPFSARHATASRVMGLLRLLALWGVWACGPTTPTEIGPRSEARPAGGRLRIGATVTLQSERPANIYYTVDGSTPDEKRGSLYSSPLAIWASTTLRFVAIDAEGRRGFVGQADYSIDGLFAQSWAEPGTGNYRTVQQIALRTDKPATVYYTLDGSDPNESSTRYLAPIAITTDTTLRFFSLDPWGNREPIQEATYNFPPRFQVSPVSGVYLPSTTDMQIESSESGRIEYSLMDGPWLRYVGPFGLQRDLIVTVRAFDLQNLLSNLETAYYGVIEPWKDRDLPKQPIVPVVSAMIDPEGFGQPAWLIAERSRLLIWRDMESGGKPVVIGQDASTPPERLRVWDMDGDGVADILVRRALGWEYWRSLGGDRYSVDLSTFGAWLTSDILDVLAGDFDGDGQLDLLLLDKRPATSRLLWRRGGRYEAGPTPKEIGSPRQALASDLDGDRHADLVVLPEEGEPYVLWGDGKGGFERTGLQPALPGLARVRWLHVGRYDVDLDGDLDLVFVGVGEADADATVGRAPKAPPDARLHLVTLHQIPGRGWRFGSRVTHEAQDIRGLMWMDADGDPYMDLLCLRESGPPLLWKNLRGATWLDATKIVGTPQGMGALGLGDPLVTGRASLYGVQAPNTVKAITPPSTHPSLRLALRGIQGNRSAWGARVRLQMDGLRLLREIGAGATGPDQPDIFLPVPLGETKQLGRLSISWGDKIEREIPNPSPNQTLLLSPQSP